MADTDLIKRRIAKLRARLEAGEVDNDTAHLRQGIAALYLSIGDENAAGHWYVEAAKFVEWCELGLRALAIVKRAKVRSNVSDTFSAFRR